MATNFAELNVTEKTNKVINEVWEAESQLCLLVINNYKNLIDRLVLKRYRSITLNVSNYWCMETIFIDLSIEASSESEFDTVILGVRVGEQILEIRRSHSFFNISNKDNFVVQERLSILKSTTIALKEILDMSEKDFVASFGD